jgi:phenylpropionate dioxygenase-like ring-hydroxylating dioxygenase large terminal subunit
VDSGKLEEILAKPLREKQRKKFPENFPFPIDIPVGRYTCPNFAQLEKQHIFNKCWQYAGHQEQIPAPGDYLLLEQFDEPVFLMRGDDLEVRAFFNSCRHRGALLLDQKCGNKRSLVCPFHGWTYSRNGSLMGYPEAKNFLKGGMQENLSLKSVRCESYGNLLFISFDVDAEPLRESLGTVAEELDTLIGDQSTGVHFADAELLFINGNWKLAGDANVESYHVPFLHRNSALPLVDQQQTGQWLLPKKHSRMMLRFNESIQASLDSAQKRMPEFPGLVHNSLPRYGIYSFHLFPSFSIVLSGSEMYFLIQAVPRGSDRMAYLIHYLTPVKRGGGQDSLIQKLVDFNSKVLSEDMHLVPGIQESMRHGGLDRLRLQYQERRIRRLHEDIDMMIGAESIPEELRVPPSLDPYVESN